MKTKVDLLKDIGFYTLEDKRAINSSVNSPLWRCELIVTDRCNLNCFYCRGLKEKNKGDLSFQKASSTVKMWADDGLKNIRFSGGEPTLWTGIYLLTALANKEKIERIAISTNGTAPLDNYKRLIDLGINDISISLDACCSSASKKMAGKDIWKTLTKNIYKLSQLTYVTVGVVLTHRNVHETERIIRFAANKLGVSDIRLIPAAYKEVPLNLGNISVDSRILENRPILLYRIVNFISGRRFRGLALHDIHNGRCPLVIDDMTIAQDHHYPCIIYLREGGEPIGPINDFNIKRIRNERYQWFKRHDCFKDPICVNNCLDVCVDYNNRWFEINKGDS